MRDGLNHSRETDLAVIDRLRAQDPSVFKGVIERYGPRLHQLAVGITRSHDDAEEVVQDAFLTLFREIRSFQGRAALGTWLYRVAANAALTKRRRQRANVHVTLADCLPTFKTDGHREGDRAFVLADWSRTPEVEFLSREVRAMLEDGLAQLPDHYRVLLVLRDVHGLSNEEVAEKLGDSVSTVKSRLHRARMALREELTRRLSPRARKERVGGSSIVTREKDATRVALSGPVPSPATLA